MPGHIFLLLSLYEKTTTFAPMTDDAAFIEQEEQDLYEHLRIVVDKGQSLLRIDKFQNLQLLWHLK